MKNTTALLGIHIRLILTMTFWGGTFVAGRLLAEEVSALTASTLRFTLAAVILLSILFIRTKQLPKLSLKLWGAMILLGLTGVFAYNIFFFSGLQTVEAGRASMIIAVNPVVTTFLAVILFGERCNLLKGCGIGLSLLGAMIVISRGELTALYREGGIGLGELLILGCVFSWSAYTLLGKKLLKETEALTVVTYSCTAGAFLLLAASLSTDSLPEATSLSSKGILCVFYLAFFGTSLGFLWFYDGVKTLGVTKAAIYINLVPVNGILLGTILLKEGLEPSLLMGGACVLTGIYLTNRN